MVTNIFPKNFSVEEFSKCFGIDPHEMPTECHKLINQFDFRYKVMSNKQRDQTLLKVFKRVDQKNVNVAGKQRLDDWNKGWNENFQALEHNHAETSLIPKYILAGLPYYTLDVPEDSVSITIWALEQTSQNYHAFLNFIIAKKPDL